MPVRLAQPRPWPTFTPALLDWCFHGTRYSALVQKKRAKKSQTPSEGIAGAQAVVILFSVNTPTACWQQKEIDGASWNEIAQDGAQCLVIRLDGTPLPPLMGPKQFAILEEDHSNYQEVLEKLCEALLSDKTASSIVAEAVGRDAATPFWRVRAEFFEDRLAGTYCFHTKALTAFES